MKIKIGVLINITNCAGQSFQLKKTRKKIKRHLFIFLRISTS